MSGLPTCVKCKSKHLDIKIDTHLYLVKTCKDCGMKVDPVMDLQHELAICMDALRDIHDRLEYGDVFYWDDSDPCWDVMRNVAINGDVSK